MSTQIQAYSLATKEKVPMKLTNIYKTALVNKKGEKTGKFRHRLAGTTYDNKYNLSKLVSKNDAEAYSKAFDVKIINKKGNVPKERRSCKDRLNEMINAKKAAKRTSAKKVARRTSSKKVAKRTSAKKAAKRTSSKKVAKRTSSKKTAGKPSVKVVSRRGAKTMN